MLQYQRYIFRHLLFILGMTLLGLTAILWLMQALRLVDFIVNQGIPVGLFLKLSALLLPSMIMMVMPVAISIAAVFLYHKLRTDSELVVLQSAGISRLQLAVPGMYVALVAMLVCYVISFVILPISTREFRDMQFFLRNNYVSVLLQDGVFSAPVEGLTVYVRQRVDDKTFRGVMVHDGRDPAAQITMMAEKADLEMTDQGPQFILYNGNRQEVRDGALSFLQFDSYVLDISVYTRGMKERKYDSDEKSVTGLLRDGEDAYPNEKEYREAVSDGHQRVIWPALTFTITLGVIGLMLSGEFNRRQSWRRNILSAALVVAIAVALIASRGLMQRYLWTVPIAYLLLMSPAILGAAALWPKRLNSKRSKLLGVS